MSCGLPAVHCQGQEDCSRKSDGDHPLRLLGPLGEVIPGGGTDMTKIVFLKILPLFVLALALGFVPEPASAHRGGGSHRSGSSHGGGSHGGGHSMFGGGGHSRGGGHSSFGGGGHSYGGFHGGGSSHAGGNPYRSGGHGNRGQMSGGSYSRLGGFSSRPSGGFARNSTYGSSRHLGSSAGSRSFGRSGGWQPAARSYGGAAGEWHSFGNSTGRSTQGWARSSGYAMGSGWHSFGSREHGGEVESSRRYGSYGRSDGPWHSFGNSRNVSFGGNAPGRSNTGFRGSGFGNSPFSGSRFDGSGFANSRFGGSSFGRSGFGNSGFGGSGFSNSFGESGASVIPSLLFGGLLHLATPLFGGVGMLGANALSYAARSLIFGLASNAFDQGSFDGGNSGFGQSGFVPSFGFQVAPVLPPCGYGANYWGPGWVWGGYCGAYPYRPLGWSGVGYFGGPGNGYILAN
jgi:hypothetical protein